MKPASPAYTTQVFEGREATVTEHRGQPIDPLAWYVGDSSGKVEGGPFPSEASAVYAHDAMCDTSGT